MKNGILEKKYYSIIKKLNLIYFHITYELLWKICK